MGIELDRQRLESIIESIGARLEGEWILVGGALVALWLEPRRVTEDVDVVGMGGTMRERLALMELAESLGLPVETLNSAVDFFIRRIEGWDRELEVFHRGTLGTIYRPTPTLFILLKIRRLSERDLEDCLVTLRRREEEGWPLDRTRLLQAIGDLPSTEDARQRERRSRLRDALFARSED